LGALEGPGRDEPEPSRDEAPASEDELPNAVAPRPDRPVAMSDAEHEGAGSTPAREVGSPSPPVVTAAVLPTLGCQLFGRFEVAIDGRPITTWRGTRGRAIFAYMVLHRGQPLRGEVMAAALWPDASAEAARNRLHVALHGLRRDLRAVCERPIVVFERGYGLDPSLNVDVDVEQFDEAVRGGQRCESAGDSGAAVLYEEAVTLYRADLLDDTPYEEWTLLPREQYRVRFLHALDRLANLRFETGSYNECIGACERLLATDSFREDVHRMLMRAYARMSQPHLALRQFETCLTQLRTELNANPEQETFELADRIRRRVSC